MTLFEKLVAETVAAEIGVLTGREAAEKLIAAGLVNPEGCRRMLIRHYVEQAVGRKRGKTTAISEAAEIYCCSFEKARAIVYDKKI